MVSKCCLKEVCVVGTEFQYYVCMKCGKPCELSGLNDESQTENYMVAAIAPLPHQYCAVR